MTADTKKGSPIESSIEPNQAPAAGRPDGDAQRIHGVENAEGHATAPGAGGFGDQGGRRGKYQPIPKAEHGHPGRNHTVAFGNAKHGQTRSDTSQASEQRDETTKSVAGPTNWTGHDEDGHQRKDGETETGASRGLP